jgi:hypothetical protein
MKSTEKMASSSSKTSSPHNHKLRNLLFKNFRKSECDLPINVEN